MHVVAVVLREPLLPVFNRGRLKIERNVGVLYVMIVDLPDRFEIRWIGKPDTYSFRHGVLSKRSLAEALDYYYMRLEMKHWIMAHRS